MEAPDAGPEAIDHASLPFGFNPCGFRVDPRTVAPFNDGWLVLATGGSSPGPAIAVAANLTMVSAGAETPGIKPTVGSSAAAASSRSPPDAFDPS